MKIQTFTKKNIEKFYRIKKNDFEIIYLKYKTSELRLYLNSF